MSIDLTKIELYGHAKILEKLAHNKAEGMSPTMLAEFLLQAAVLIEGNTENLGHAAKTCQNLALSCEILSERIDILKDRIERLEQPRP